MAKTNDDFSLVVGEDGLARPAWAAHDPLMRDYYDTEWGMPVRDERRVFERLALEAFQSGLSWGTILRKRPAFREAFDGFDPDVVAAYGPEDVERLMADAAIVRNHRKILATITNAQATVALRDADDVDGGLAGLMWSYQPKRTPLPRTGDDVPAQTPESEALAKDLRARGFTFVGPVNVFACMAAMGIVDVHIVGSHRRGSSGLWTRTGERRRGPACGGRGRGGDHHREGQQAGGQTDRTRGCGTA